MCEAILGNSNWQIKWSHFFANNCAKIGSGGCSVDEAVNSKLGIKE